MAVISMRPAPVWSPRHVYQAPTPLAGSEYSFTELGSMASHGFQRIHCRRSVRNGATSVGVPLTTRLRVTV